MDIKRIGSRPDHVGVLIDIGKILRFFLCIGGRQHDEVDGDRFARKVDIVDQARLIIGHAVGSNKCLTSVDLFVFLGLDVGHHVSNVVIDNSIENIIASGSHAIGIQRGAAGLLIIDVGIAIEDELNVAQAEHRAQLGHRVYTYQSVIELDCESDRAVSSACDAIASIVVERIVAILADGLEPAVPEDPHRVARQFIHLLGL